MSARPNPKSPTLPPAVRAECQRILDREARRILADRLREQEQRKGREGRRRR